MAISLRVLEDGRMVVEFQAHSQYDDMQGSITLDDGDFESLQSVLGLGNQWHVLGMSLFCHHPSLGIEGKSAADSTHTILRVWAMSDELLHTHGQGKGIPGVIESVQPLPVTEFKYDTPDLSFGTGFDAISIVLRASKRVQVVAWDKIITSANLGVDDLELIDERSMIREGNAWVESPPDY